MKSPSYNLVLRDKNWVMENLAKHFNKYITNCKISDHADYESDINFYFNWHSFDPKAKFNVSYFTHIEKDIKSVKRWHKVASLTDVCVVMGARYRDKVPKNKRVIFYPPPFECYNNESRVKILVVGRRYQTGRKNYVIIKEIEKHCRNACITFTEGKMTEEELFKAYEETDYVLVTSTIEAGPMSVVEAISMRKPVIAPRVGWCWEYPVIKYSNTKNLIETINKLSFNNNDWEKRVKGCVRGIEKIYDKV
jgi:hypothetical protein